MKYTFALFLIAATFNQAVLATEQLIQDADIENIISQTFTAGFLVEQEAEAYTNKRMQEELEKIYTKEKVVKLQNTLNSDSCKNAREAIYNTLSDKRKGSIPLTQKEEQYQACIIFLWRYKQHLATNNTSDKATNDCVEQYKAIIEIFETPVQSEQ